MKKFSIPDISQPMLQWVEHNFKGQKGTYNENLYNAMRYSFDAGGKRLRPLLLLSAYNLKSEHSLDSSHPAMPFAVAYEMVHTYSLIHDDLPGMDNDDLRRGKPTNHIVFGEAVAILAGDGLLTGAFEIFSDSKYSNIAADKRLLALNIFAKAAGADGMVGGQYADMAAENVLHLPQAARLEEALRADRLPLLKYIQENKTAALIRAALMSGAVLAGATDKEAAKLEEYGTYVGLAFQIKDDILDIISTTEELGKPVGSDEKSGKLTYPSLVGMDNSKKQLSEYIERAHNCLEIFDGEASVLLHDLASYLEVREH